ncbi:MAG: hypothetical protein ACYDHN_12085 [Solirubrobacteraceae bacterium]
MTSHVRKALVALLVSVTAGASASTAQASFGVTEPDFEAGTCNVRTCTYESIEGNPSEAFTHAAGHPAWGITSVELNSKSAGLGAKEPEGALKRLRVDVPPGLAANPEALPKCSVAAFNSDTCPGNTEVGETELTVFLLLVDTNITGKVYNLEQPSGLPLEFGIHVEVPAVANEHIFLEGHVKTYADSHGPADYHEYFEINNISKSIPVLKSKLLFKGTAGNGNFLTIPSACSSSTTSHVEVESYEGAVSTAFTHTPVGVEHCNEVPFKPTVSVTGAPTTSDQPDGASTVVKVPQNASSTNTSDVKDAHVTLPEGMTLNPSAAHGLTACTSAEIAIGEAKEVKCPESSRVGTVTIETDLPPKSLSGGVYLGSPTGATITKPPFTLYLDAESARYGVSVRLKGTVTPNPSTGRLEVSFTENPQLPFSELILSVNGGPRAPLANPLSCSTVTTNSAFTPYTVPSVSALTSSPFTATGCAMPVPFSLNQSTQNTTSTAGAYTGYTFNLQRSDGQQYLSQLKAVLPAGLVGDIPSVPLCKEPNAQAGTCPEASKIGTATVKAGSGSEPYEFSGPVSLTGPYNGAPYGLSIPIEAAAGPFDLGRVTTRVGISVDPYTSRVIATSSIPTIVEGIPLRLKSLSVNVNRSKFLFNPTNCNPQATDSVLGSTFGASQSLSSPFQVSKCTALPFKPTFKALTTAKGTKKNGTSLQVSMTQPGHEANLRSVVASLPIQLPSRLSTLQKACPEATFAADPTKCPPLSKVGNASVSTPVLPQPLGGPAYLVSHGGAGFPDLDLILDGNGVRVILVGNTDIKKGITTSTFASIPDVPVSSFTLDLPMAENSVLTAYGNLCIKPLLMPTTITAQSGAVIKQSTRIAVSSCGVRILSHRVTHHKLILRVRTLGGGLLSVKGKGLHSSTRRVGRSSTVRFVIPLTRGGLQTLRKHRHRGLKVHVRVLFNPSKTGAPSSAAEANAKFKH